MGHWYTQGELAAGRRGDADRETAKEALRSEARASRMRSSARGGNWWDRLQGLGSTFVHFIRKPRAAVQGIRR